MRPDTKCVVLLCAAILLLTLIFLVTREDSTPARMSHCTPLEMANVTSHIGLYRCNQTLLVRQENKGSEATLMLSVYDVIALCETVCR